MIEKCASLEEIERHWSLEDLLDANLAVDIRIRAERDATERAKAK